MSGDHATPDRPDAASGNLDALRAEVDELRRRVGESAARTHDLENRLLETKGHLSLATSQNDRLSSTLLETRQTVAALRAEVEKLSAPPTSYGTVTGTNDDDTVDVMVGGRKLKVHCSVGLDVQDLERGSEVVLNESMNIVSARRAESVGEVLTIKEMLPDGVRAVVTGRGEEERVCELADALRGMLLRPGDLVRCDPRTSLLIERLPQPEVDELLLEATPEVTYGDIGGLDSQIEQIADAVELPFLHGDLFAEHQLPAPKGVLLYGPPGCGKTLIAKAVANSLAAAVARRSGGDKARSYFISIKGPELLNKYVGETERRIRLVFQRAREKSDEGWPVIIFFDEMDSMFRTRGSGISSDMESTIVPQLLAEIDGVESLRNVIVIGATNREDLIDPAILRPGRLDVKIKIDRPDREAAATIFARYLTSDIPLAHDEVEQHGSSAGAVGAMILSVVSRMYDESPENRFLEVTYQNGDKEELYFRDFASGAMIENIVRRAKKLAIKRHLAGGEKGVSTDDLVASVRQEFREHEDLPNTTNPDDWARISGKKGERIVYIRTLVEAGPDAARGQGGRAIERAATGQYL